MIIVFAAVPCEAYLILVRRRRSELAFYPNLLYFVQNFEFIVSNEPMPEAALNAKVFEAIDPLRAVELSQVQNYTAST